MNERIKRLADEAAKYSAVMALPTGQSGNELFVEKLAELIIKECVGVVEKRFMGDLNREDMEVRRCVADLKQHFGVEE